MAPGDLGRKSLLMLAGTWGSSLLGMLISVLVARRLGADAMGSLGVGIGFAGIVMAALLPGFVQAHIKRLADGEDPGRCIGTLAAIQAALVGAVLLVLAGVAAGGGGRLVAPDLGAVLVLMLASQLAANTADVFLKVLVVREWVVDHAAIVLGARLARLAVTVAVLVWQPRVSWVAASFVVEGVVAGAGAAAWLGRRGIVARRPTRESLASYWRYARPLLVTNPIALFQDGVDRVVVGWWAGLAAAGHYHVARALWEALSSVIAAPGLFVFTRLSALYRARTPAGDAEARRFFAGGVDKLLFVTMPMALVAWALAEGALALLYGTEFRAAAPALRILVLATVAANCVNPYTYVLYALEQAGRLIPVNLLRVVVYVAVLAALVPPAGLAALGPLPHAAAGAALARLVLIVVPAWVYPRWTREAAGVGFHAPTWTYLAGFGLMLAVDRAALALLGGDPGPLDVRRLAAVAAALAVYLAFLLRAHPGTGDNLRYAAALLSPGRAREFVRAGRGAP
jgi:O-antigen/teichoic acid export membrane protein